jgi:hypothetical protein
MLHIEKSKANLFPPFPSENGAYFNLGIALHTLKDATSPAHTGFQPWSDFTSWAGSGNPRVESATSHVAKELTYPGTNSNLQRITTEVINLFQAGKNLPEGDLFKSIGSD